MKTWSRLAVALTAINIWAAGSVANGQITLTTVQNDWLTHADADDGAAAPATDTDSDTSALAPDTGHIVSSVAADGSLSADSVADLTISAITTGADFSYDLDLSTSATADALAGPVGADADALLTSAVTFATTIPVRFEFTNGSYQNSGAEPIATAVSLIIEQDTGSGFSTIFTGPFTDAPTPQSFASWVPGVYGPADYRITAQVFANEAATPGTLVTGESNLSFTISVPEPGIGFLAAIALGFFARRRR